jgi:hypothetical protein
MPVAKYRDSEGNFQPVGGGGPEEVFIGTTVPVNDEDIWIDPTTPTQYYRDPTSGAYVPIIGSGLGIATGDARYVKKTGDTMSGSLVADGALTGGNTGGGGGVSIKPGTADHAYFQIYARTAAPTTRSAYIGYGSAGTNQMSLVNQLTNGGIALIPNGTGRVSVNADPLSALDVSTKQYTDGKVAKTGDTMTGDLTINKADPYLIFDNIAGYNLIWWKKHDFYLFGHSSQGLGVATFARDGGTGRVKVDGVEMPTGPHMAVSKSYDDWSHGHMTFDSGKVSNTTIVCHIQFPPVPVYTEPTILFNSMGGFSAADGVVSIGVVQDGCLGISSRIPAQGAWCKAGTWQAYVGAVWCSVAANTTANIYFRAYTTAADGSYWVGGASWTRYS